MFEIANYERIIARICRSSDGYPVGTGVAVAPSYVLTCAHVVLAAIGEAADARAKPDRDAVIPLDFGLNPDLRDQTFQAIVVEWLPYGEDNTGDIALLKLLKTPAPALRPLKFARWDGRADADREYRTTGFPEQYSQTTKNYRPQARIYDDRLQLEKDDNTEMRKIDAGYSGAPILDCQTGCLIGIVTTVETNNNYRAFAISTRRLERFKLAERLAAHEFADALRLDELSFVTPNDRTILNTLDQLLQEFNLSDDDKSRRDRLSELSRDRAPAEHWKTEGNLAYFATRLRQYEHLPNDFRDRCVAYLASQSHDFVNSESCSSHFSLMSMSWNPQLKAEFRAALLDRYRSVMKLQIFLADAIGADLNRLAGNGNLEEVCFEAIEELDAQGELDALYLEFRAENRNKPFSQRSDLLPQDARSGSEPKTSSVQLAQSSEWSPADYERAFIELQNVLKLLQAQHPNVHSESEALDIIDAEVTSESAPQDARLVNLKQQFFNLERHLQAIKATTAEVAKHYLEESVWAKAGITYIDKLSETPDRGA